MEHAQLKARRWRVDGLGLCSVQLKGKVQPEVETCSQNRNELIVDCADDTSKVQLRLVLQVGAELELIQRRRSASECRPSTRCLSCRIIVTPAATHTSRGVRYNR